MEYVMPDEPWAVREESFPWRGDRADQLRFLLNYAVLAPSIYNTQPWLFKITGAEVAIYVDRSRTLPVCDPCGRNVIISCGAALFHLRTAAKHFGFEPTIRTFPDLEAPDLLAFIRLGERKEATPEEHQLFRAIKTRRTIRSEFSSGSVPADVLVELQRAAEREGTRLFVVQDALQRGTLIDLIREADELRNTDGQYQSERNRWIAAPGSHNPANGNIFPHVRAGASALSGSLMLRGLAPGQLYAIKEGLEAEDPVFAIVGTVRDNAPAWLSAGQALGRVLLTAANHNLNAAFLSQPIGLDRLRARLGAILGDGVCPQMILRIGYGVPGTPTRREPVRHVMLEA